MRDVRTRREVKTIEKKKRENTKCYNSSREDNC